MTALTGGAGAARGAAPLPQGETVCPEGQSVVNAPYMQYRTLRGLMHVMFVALNPPSSPPGQGLYYGGTRLSMSVDLAGGRR
jgi:hypothetical protein